MCVSWIWSSISTRSTLFWTKSFSQARFKRQASRSFSRDWNTWISWSRRQPCLILGFGNDMGILVDNGPGCIGQPKPKQSFARSFRCTGGFQIISVLFMFKLGAITLEIIRSPAQFMPLLSGRCRNHRLYEGCSESVFALPGSPRVVW